MPAIMTSPVRAAAPAALTSSTTVPGPVPDVPLDTLIQGAWLTACQAQPAAAVTVTSTRAPPASATACSGDRVKTHAARCVTSNRRSLMTMAPLRSTGCWLLATLNEICDSPWPLAGDTEIHATSGLADHVHSRLMVSATIPLPPALSTSGGVAESVSAQRTAVGAAEFDVDAELHAVASKPHRIATAVEMPERVNILRA